MRQNFMTFMRSTLSGHFIWYALSVLVGHPAACRAALILSGINNKIYQKHKDFGLY